MNDKNTWVAIVNPNAGSGKTMANWMEAEKKLSQRNIPFTVRTTKGPGHASILTSEAAQKGYRNFLAVGGDGTVHETLSGIMNFLDLNREFRLSEFTLAVIPIGSGNDWLRSLGIRRKMDEVIELIASGARARQDVVRVTLERFELEKNLSRSDSPHGGNSQWIVNVGGVCFDARICEIVNREKDAGISHSMIYLRAVLRTLFSYTGSKICIECDGEQVYRGNCFSVSFGNGKYSGGGLRQTPDALMDDGLLDMTIIPKATLGLAIKGIPRLLTGGFTKVETVIARKGKRITIAPIGPQREIVEADGEVIGSLPAIFEVMDDQLNVLAPLGR